MGPAGALFSHYRRHPLQLVSLALIIMLATALWASVWTLTDQARDSLERSEAALAARFEIARQDGATVTVRDFARLRRAGTCVTPWLIVEPGDGGARRIGVDPLTLNCLDGHPASEGSGTLDGDPFLDLSGAARLPGDHRLHLLAPERADVPDGYRVQPFAGAPATGELGDSFLLNLNALSALTLLIAALLIRSVYSLSLSQRRASLELLHRQGLTRRRLAMLMASEMVVISLLAALPGLVIGHGLASVASDGFGQAMASLFDASLTSGRSLSGSLLSLGVILLVVLWCVADHWLPARRSAIRRHPVAIGSLVMIAGGTGVLAADALWELFLAIALGFVGVGLLTPPILAAWCHRRRATAPGWLAHWRRRELSALLRDLALPVVALQFALATVIAVQALVATFESTFQAWLDQRLQGDVYIERPSGMPHADMAAWLDGSSLVAHWHRVRRDQARLEGVGPAVDRLVLDPASPLLQSWQFLRSERHPWAALGQGGVMVNEQLARRQNLALGDTVTVRWGEAFRSGPLVAVYADYGRPAGEVLLPSSAAPQDWRPSFVRYAVRLTETVPIAELSDSFPRAGEARFTDNNTIHQLATGVFDQTFFLTRAISVLTLALSALSLLLMGTVVFRTRARYLSLLRVWGLSRQALRRQVRRLGLTLTGLVAAASLLPGIALTWVLVSRINPLAFGWSLPMAVYPLFWLELGLICLVIGWGIGTWMGRQTTLEDVGGLS
ncbi:putative ABC transport system permease protein [Tamilnaduibacter salinus]|uniref:Putative ABC transport system permease protein n=1 Tax=Tamilnaduibacter salinus TaxID=1484056 RepID=A0A2U1D0Y3_9GAMM|nr:ABC transporter permease [Tamilnaduibacter salinus]PVY79030.1 putative ABC transport system permease protein [Tamilnaduibacter salinus]